MFQAENTEHRIDHPQGLKHVVLLIPVKIPQLDNRVCLFDEIEQSSDSPGNIEVVVHGLTESILQFGHIRRHLRMREASGQAEELAGVFVNPLQRGSGGIQPFVGKQQRLAVMDAQQHEAEFSTGIAFVQDFLQGHDVAGCLRHFSAVL